MSDTLTSQQHARIGEIGESARTAYDAMNAEYIELGRKLRAADKAWRIWDVDGMWRNGLLSDSEAMELESLIDANPEYDDTV